MFGRKKIIPLPSSASATAATFIVMPDIFYGGQDPDLYHSVAKSGPASAAKIQRQHPPFMALLGARAWLAISAVFLLAAGGISWYYLRGSVPASAPPAAENRQIVPSAEPSLSAQIETPAIVKEVATSTPLTTPLADTEPKSLRDAPLEFPAFGLPSSSDLDSDGLTDAEEVMFQTDSGAWDTDGDGYNDGLEALNLYSPRGTAPQKLVDSGIVQDYINPRWQYRVYRLTDWEVGTVDPASNEVLMSSVSGDFIVARAFPKDEQESFLSWFARVVPSESFGELLASKNIFGVDMWLRRDREAAYIESPSAVFVLHYGARDNQRELDYPHVLEMMAQSFRTSQTDSYLPEQTPLPPVNN